ncbi:MAG: endonuclease III [Treponema sp.]|nr:endonuclease III [Treponema sp.]
MKLLSQKEIVTVLERFKKQNPEPKSELQWTNPYTLLVSVVLSAQATDKSVNKATEPLYKIADTPSKMIKLGQDKLESYIKTIGLYHAKAKNVIALSKMIVNNFSGKVPSSFEELMMLPGVGRKTANVVLNVLYGAHTMPVDTHILRIAPKIGLAEGHTPEQVEMSLLERVPKKYMTHAHHWFILHGRYTCTARSPKCNECIINDICLHNKMND